MVEEQEIVEAAETPPVDASDPHWESVPASVEAVRYVRQLYQVPEDAVISLDQVLGACILGSPQTVARLQALTPDEPITLEVLEGMMQARREAQAKLEVQYSMAISKAQRTTHSLESCAQAIVGQTNPQVMEQIEIAMQTFGHQAWQVIASVMVAYKNQLIFGGDLTEVRPAGEGMHLQIGQQAWSPVAAPKGQTLIQGTVPCETCGNNFAPTSNQHRPRFGCPACGMVETLRVKNSLEEKRAKENDGYVPTIRPTTLEYVMYTMGAGRCTCGEVPSLAS